jgi:D-alanyl-D-alanine carboxypeptidase
MRVLLVLMSIVLASSCITQKKRLEICGTCPVEVNEVMVEVLKDTTIYLTEQGETKYLDNPCADLCDSLGNLKPFETEIESEGRKVILYSQGDKLAVRADLDSLAADVQVKYITHTVKQTIQGECVKTRLMKIQAWFFWIAIAGIAVFIYFKIKP